MKRSSRKIRTFFTQTAISTLFMLASFILVSTCTVKAQEAPAANDIKVEENKNKAVKADEKSKPEPAEKKSTRDVNIDQKTTTDLDRKLEKLNNLYVPIHWSDAITGLAIGGYDPITYFEMKNAKAGDDIYQMEWHGVTWRFISKGNMLAFRRTPSIYAPRFAGYDPYALSNGLLSEGLPTVWSIIEGKLYLFHNEVNLFLWHENRKDLTEKVSRNWKELSIDLPRYKIRQ